MSSMQEFYLTLSSPESRLDPYWKTLIHITKVRLDKIRLLADILGWYFWSAS